VERGPSAVAGLAVSACRFCAAPLEHVFADLGTSPLANAYLTAEQVNAMEPFYPLCALVCSRCLLVQLEEYETPSTIFGDYAYFSSYSSSWLAHAERYVADVVERFGLDAGSHVVELASNDGYLLRYVQARGIGVLGIEPAANVAEVASRDGIPTLVEFFGERLARSLDRADLVVANNVLAHVPDLNDFVAGAKILLKPEGVMTVEVPWLARLIALNQWDTIYHEHFSYFSLAVVRRVFAAHGLRVFDVVQLPTHGGSLRIFACHDDGAHAEGPRVRAVLRDEQAAGLDALVTYLAYGERVVADKRAIVSLLHGLKDEGLRIAGYGAAAKGNTLLNYCGLRTDVLDYTCDLNPHKHDRFLPGTHIPIRDPEWLREDRPDVVLILPWNLKDEIMDQLSFVRDWGGRFAARSPELRLFA
jgi:SAM-dependent methyltransferase